MCPFHTDIKRGNFTVWGDPKSGFKCFACGVSGDLIDFMKRVGDRRLAG
jgi:DNA primase